MRTLHGLVGFLALLMPFHLVTSALAAEPTSSGKELFEREWQPKSARQVAAILGRAPARIRAQLQVSDGLGPFFNGKSCAQCHPQGGSSGVQNNVMMLTIDPKSPIVTNPRAFSGSELVSIFPNVLDSGGNLLIESPVHAESTLAGYKNTQNNLFAQFAPTLESIWSTPKERTSEAILAQPTHTMTRGPVTMHLGQRNTPPLFGLGLIDKISPAQMHIVAKHQAIKTNGRISGRVVGKFGWRGQVSNLESFVMQACKGELGILPGRQTTFAKEEIDLTEQDFHALRNHVATLPPPEDHSLQDEDAILGKKVFTSIGCAHCHVPDLPPARGVFSDLLLHDLGPGLAAPLAAPVSIGIVSGKNPELLQVPKFRVAGTSVAGMSTGAYGGGGGGAGGGGSGPPVETAVLPNPAATPNVAYGWPDWKNLQQEWRTPPLWGVADSAPYLHDGRAATLEQAILLHGGESKHVRDAYLALDSVEQGNVLRFLSSLKAPVLESEE